MGWSCRKDAMDTLQKIEKVLCIGPSANEFQINGKAYIIDTGRTDHADGAITGTLWRDTGDGTHYTCAGSWRIEGDGRFSRGASVLRRAAKGLAIIGLQVPEA